MSADRMKHLTDIQQEITNDIALNRYVENVQKYYSTDSQSISSEIKSGLENEIKSFESKQNKSLLPREHRWRLMIDGRNQTNENCHPLEFDGCEPGYHAAMYRAFELMEHTINQPLTVDLIVALHDMAIDGVKTEKGSLFAKGIISEPKKGKFGLTNRGLSGSNVSDAGFKEMVLQIKNTDAFFEIKDQYNNTIDDDFYEKVINDTYTFSQMCADKIELYRYGKLNSPAEVIKQLQELINTYYQNISSASSPELTLKAIADFAHQANLLHPFWDGNIRTLVFLVVNKLLLQNGFPPAIFNDPNRFDGHTVNELYIDIIEGMEKAKMYGFIPLSRTRSAPNLTSAQALGLFPNLDEQKLSVTLINKSTHNPSH